MGCHRGVVALFVLLMALSGCQRPVSEEGAGSQVSISEPNGETGAAIDLFKQGEWIDLTYPFNEETIYWPTADGFRFTDQTADETSSGYFYAANSFATAEHGGTHIDAPIHFARNQQTVDQIPISRLIGEAVVIDVTDRCSADPDYQVTVADLRAWEEEHNRQLVDVIVLLKTGYGAYWPNRTKYLGTDERGDEAVRQLHFPGLHPDAAQWLAEHRLPKVVGIDTASIDYGPSRDFASHVTLFKHDIPALENVANLAAMPPTGARVIALPMKIGHGSGGPTRIVAVLPPPADAE